MLQVGVSQERKEGVGFATVDESSIVLSVVGILISQCQRCAYCRSKYKAHRITDGCITTAAVKPTQRDSVCAGNGPAVVGTNGLPCGIEQSSV